MYSRGRYIILGRYVLHSLSKERSTEQIFRLKTKVLGNNFSLEICVCRDEIHYVCKNIKLRCDTIDA